MKLLSNIGKAHKTPSAAQSRLAIIAGLEGLVKRLDRDGETKLSKIVETHLEKCRELLTQYNALAAITEKGWKKPLQELAGKTATAIEKILPAGVFENHACATAWVIENMPLTSARQDESTNTFKYSEQTTQLREISNSLWARFNKACSDATGNSEDTNKAFSESILQSGFDRML